MIIEWEEIYRECILEDKSLGSLYGVYEFICWKPYSIGIVGVAFRRLLGLD